MKGKFSRDTNGDTCVNENERGGTVGVPRSPPKRAGKRGSRTIKVGSVDIGGSTGDGRLAGNAESFSAALLAIASLPLSDAEKAEAVRRLMAEQDGSMR